METSQTVAQERDKLYTLQSLALTTTPAPVAWERDNLDKPHAPWSQAPAAVPPPQERDKPPASQSQVPAAVPVAVAWVKPPAHGPLQGTSHTPRGPRHLRLHPS
ncbi:hypothetical protein MDA_GLEAN10013589 [Myotis davidii]|uniref:Uncharacterized protein n=1 Tax=Myotis davidii TaxID=225400 RepID=L5MGV0_MYODS|nr:hypothetical protein MDA_GLEAN10013589 [Myotis davidii]